MSSRKQRLRLAAAAAISAGLLVPLAAFSGAGFASPSSAQYQYKITICHHTHSTKNPWVTIRVSNTAWKAHLKHHDTMGPCPPKPPSSPVTTTTTATSAQASVSGPVSSSSPGKSGESHGNSGSSSGNSGESHGNSGESHGNSGNAPGHNK
jgi:uncharacterized membrane protein YgcG